MYITNKLINFLDSSSIISRSTIVLTNLDTVVFSSNDTTYLNCSISDNLKKFLDLFSQDISSIDYINNNMSNIVPITANDDISKCKSQIILPIVHHNIVDGLLIFMSCNRFYIKSNLTYAKNARHFVELLTCSDFL